MATIAANKAILIPISIFLGLREQNITFCLDISGSMNNSLTTVKEQLIHYLLEQSVLARLNLNRLFNLIAFSTDVYPWSNGMVLWNTATVNNAINWIKDLETKTGTNTLDALATAFQDTQTNAVVLVTDDISDQDPYAVLNKVAQIAHGRPVHCIYVSAAGGRDEDQSAVEFLKNIFTVTRGSLKIVTIGRNGVEKITPIQSFHKDSVFQLTNLSLNSNATPVVVNSTLVSQLGSSLATVNIPTSDYTNLSAKVNFNSVTLPIQTQTNTYTPSILINNFQHPKWLSEPANYTYPTYVMHPRVFTTQEGKLPSKSIAWSRFRPLKVQYDGTVCGLMLRDSYLPVADDIVHTPDAGSLLLNKTVLARSNTDGYYYKGKVINQVLAHRFMVQFGPSQHEKLSDTSYQDTAIYDIIHYDDAHSHAVEKNDCVLAPLAAEDDRYAPGKILEGFEKRSSIKDTHKRNDHCQKLLRNI